jgi:UDP-N-acetylmuramate dehydrogenase
MGVGGPVSVFRETETEQDFVDAVRAADMISMPVLVIGGGSNLLASDERFDGLVLRDRRKGHLPTVAHDDGTVDITVFAGQDWDKFVAGTVRHGWAGVEALSGIPGTVGAAPVQNIGAYGQDVSQTIKSVRVFDRLSEEIVEISNADLDFGYRASLLKDSMAESPRWYPTPRYVVLEVTFTLTPGDVSIPIAYSELANALGVAVGERAPLAQVRDAVLELRAGKGMLAPLGEFAADYDRWSAGSFFTNPILTAAAAAQLPPEAPRFPVKPRGSVAVVEANATSVVETNPTAVVETNPTAAEPDATATAAEPAVKTSAAWLIGNAGFGKGFGVYGPDSKATLSTRHTLALTNRGEATAADIAELARAIQAGVQERFGATLEPEPITIGFRI